MRAALNHRKEQRMNMKNQHPQSCFGTRTMALTLLSAWLVILLSSSQPNAARTELARPAVGQAIQTGLPGSLDTTFGSGGIVTTSFETISNPNSIAIQRDGKLVVAGSLP